MNSSFGTRPSIAIVGGGLSGIAVALELAKSKTSQVTIYEKAGQLGGLYSPYRWQDIVCDRFYHVLLPSDCSMLGLLRELGLEDRLDWAGSKSGFYGRKRLVSFTSAVDFIRFPFLSPWQKFRLGVGIFYSSKITSLERLDRFTVRQWMTRVYGRKVYRNFWEPLVRSKLGDAAEWTSAVFLGATIKRLYGARSRSRFQEKMGTIRGGSHALQDAAARKLSEVNVEIRTKTPVERVSYQEGKLLLQCPLERRLFDKVLLAVPNPEIQKILQDVQIALTWTRTIQTEYLGIVCLLLILKHSLSPYYVINLLDENLSFTGVIESTNLLPEGNFEGRYLVYLPKYVTLGDPLNRISDEGVKEVFLNDLKKIFTGFKDENILHAQLFRESFVQPIRRPRNLEFQPSVCSPLPGIYMVNSSLMKNAPLNNNAIVNMARTAARLISADLLL